MNERVRHFLKDNPDVNIIGIDRGERHLLYMTLINQKGEILKQKSFNIVESVNSKQNSFNEKRNAMPLERVGTALEKLKILKKVS
jgi:CRISPR-associated protein Cpf1